MDFAGFPVISMLATTSIFIVILTLKKMRGIFLISPLVLFLIANFFFLGSGLTYLAEDGGILSTFSYRPAVYTDLYYALVILLVASVLSVTGSLRSKAQGSATLIRPYPTGRYASLFMVALPVSVIGIGVGAWISYQYVGVLSLEAVAILRTARNTSELVMPAGLTFIASFIYVCCLTVFYIERKPYRVAALACVVALLIVKDLLTGMRGSIAIGALLLIFMYIQASYARTITVRRTLFLLATSVVVTSLVVVVRATEIDFAILVKEYALRVFGNYITMGYILENGISSPEGQGFYRSFQLEHDMLDKIFEFVFGISVVPSSWSEQSIYFDVINGGLPYNSTSFVGTLLQGVGPYACLVIIVATYAFYGLVYRITLSASGEVRRHLYAIAVLPIPLLFNGFVAIFYNVLIPYCFLIALLSAVEAFKRRMSLNLRHRVA